MANEKLSIRLAGMTDLDRLCELLAQLFEVEVEFQPRTALQRRALQMLLADRKIGLIFVACHGQWIIGMVSLLLTLSTALGGRAAWLEDIVVDREVRGQGVGTALLDHAMGHACRIGCKRLTLLTDFDNTHAQRWYLRQGFQLSSMRAYRKLL